MSNTSVCRIEAVTVREDAILIDAQHLSRPSVNYRNTPVLADFSAMMAVPKVGQRVVVTRTEDGFEYVEGVLSGPDSPAPKLEENELAFQFDPTTSFTVQKNDSGGYDISLEASGDVSVKADGDIFVGENGEKVAKQNHTHDHSWTDSGGSGTTTTPNESGTNTKIE